MSYEGLSAEVIGIQGHGGKTIPAYVARPFGPGPYPGVLFVMHLPGWDEWCKEQTRKFAHHGYVAICPNLFADFGEGAADDVAARARAGGGVADADVVADAEGAIRFLRGLPSCNGKVGVIGPCSGGRHAHVIACQSKEPVDAVVNLWGGRTVQAQADLTPKQPVSPHELSKNLKCPYLGLFGNEDRNPTPEQVNVLETELKKLGKNYEFHRYDGAGHGFFYYDRPMYRLEPALDGWKKVFAFFEKNLDARVPAGAR
jgi:carboxymethylenebutenolidase